MKESRLHPRTLMGAKVRFGIDDPIHNGISYDFSSNGMSIIGDEVLPDKSNIIIKIDTENGGGFSIKEKRLYSRTHFTEKVKFGYDKPKYNGISVDISPDGMSIISDKPFAAGFNLIINIYVKKIKVDDTEKFDIITVEGEVVWVKHSPDALSRMGIRFKESNEELVRIYAAKKPRSK